MNVFSLMSKDMLTKSLAGIPSNNTTPAANAWRAAFQTPLDEKGAVAKEIIARGPKTEFERSQMGNINKVASSFSGDAPASQSGAAPAPQVVNTVATNTSTPKKKVQAKTSTLLNGVVGGGNGNTKTLLGE